MPKGCYHHGLQSDAHFRRNRTGRDIDVCIEGGDRLNVDRWIVMPGFIIVPAWPRKFKVNARGGVMDSLKERISGEPLHSRCIDMRTYAVDENTILVEGWLREDRFDAVYDLTGEQCPPGPVHHMAIRLLVGGTPPTILDAEAEMAHVPLEICQTTLEAVSSLIGLDIAAGFRKKVRRLMGGEKGCAHLTHLLTVMSQAVFQGAIAHKRRHPIPLPPAVEDVAGLEYLVGSCRAWGADGPKMKRLKAAVKKNGQHGCGSRETSANQEPGRGRLT